MPDLLSPNPLGMYHDLCLIFLQRFEVFQGVGDGVQLIVEGV
jgi:hypothetical protein